MVAFPLAPARLIGWVMRRNRLRMQAVTGARMPDAIGTLRDLGLAVDESRVSRWELGRIATNAQVLEAYERLCALPPFTLRAVAAEAHRVVGKRFDLAGSESVGSAHDVLDAVLVGEQPASGELLGAFERVYVAAADAYLPHDLAGRIAEIVMSRVGAIRSRDRITNRALARSVAGVPRARGVLVDGMVECALAPQAGEISEVLELLVRFDPVRSTDVLVELLDRGQIETTPVALAHARHLIAQRRATAKQLQTLRKKVREFGPPDAMGDPDRSHTSDTARCRQVRAVVLRHSELNHDVGLVEDSRAVTLIGSALLHPQDRQRRRASLGLVSGEVTDSLAPALVELMQQPDVGLAHRAALLLEYLPVSGD